MLIRGTVVVYKCPHGHLTPVYVRDSGPEPRAIYCIQKILEVPCSEHARISNKPAPWEPHVEFFKPNQDELEALLKRAPELVERAITGGLLIRDRT